jgi:hypothetical protein
MSQKEALLAAVAIIKANKKAPIPPGWVEATLLAIEKPNETTKTTVDNIIAGLEEHAIMTSLNAFKYTHLPLKLPTLESIKSIVAFQSVIDERNRATEALARDGIAISVSAKPTPAESDKGTGKYVISLEDLKGRSFDVAAGTLNEPAENKVTLDDGKGGQKTFYGFTFTPNKSSLMLPNNITEKLNKSLLNVVGLMVDPAKIKKYGNFWFASAPGLQTTASKEKKLPIPLGFASTALNAQLAKTDRTLIHFLANTTRKGVTYPTLYKNSLEFVETHKALSFEGLIAELRKGPKEIAPLTPAWINYFEHTYKNYKMSNEAIASRITVGAMSSPALLNFEASTKKMHEAISLDTAPSNKTHTKNQAKNTHKDLPPIKKAGGGTLSEILTAEFETYTDELSPEQLSKKMLEAASPNMILPMSNDDIKAVHNMVDTMQSHPGLASHSIHWLSAFIHEKQVQQLGIQPQNKNEKRDTSAPSESVRRTRG